MQAWTQIGNDVEKNEAFQLDVRYEVLLEPHRAKIKAMFNRCAPPMRRRHSTGQCVRACERQLPPLICCVHAYHHPRRLDVDGSGQLSIDEFRNLVIYYSDGEYDEVKFLQWCAARAASACPWLAIDCDPALRAGRQRPACLETTSLYRIPLPHPSTAGTTQAKTRTSGRTASSASPSLAGGWPTRQISRTAGC